MTLLQIESDIIQPQLPGENTRPETDTDTSDRHQSHMC